MGLRLNIGCGSHLLPGWINLDPAPIPGTVRGCADAIPLADGSVECAVMFDVIEHLHPRKEVGNALREIARVLQPGGVLRI